MLIKLENIWVVGSYFKHRDLLIRFTKRYVERQTKGSWLGWTWLVLNPLLMLMLFTVVFGLIMGGSFRGTESSGPWDYPLGIFLGLSIMGLLTESIGVAPSILVSSSNFVKKVVFPLEILPICYVNSIMFKTVVKCLLSILGILFFGPPLTFSALWFPVIIFPLYVTGIGVSYFLAALGVFFRDLQQLTGFIAQALFYASAIFYPASMIPRSLYDWLKWNPVLQSIELSRDVLLWDAPLNFKILIYLYIVAGISLSLGYLTFQGLRHGFADVL